MQKLKELVLLSILSLGLGACQRSSNANILVIAVDQFGIDESVCSRERPDQRVSGVQLLCGESVRFSHAFTTSTSSVAAIASVLTGKYPAKHGLRNPDDFLKSEEFTVAEFALEKGFQTSFFSGAAPVLRRSGIHQGFEFFEDSFSLSPQSLPFQSFSESSLDFFSWIDDDLGSAPFFSVIYAPDLRFVETETVSESGDIRSRTFESQLENFDVALGKLISNMKARNLWDKTEVIVLGLNGHLSDEKSDQIPPMNLHSLHTQVGLFIKPVRKFRETGLQWTIDQNVSLADIGMTLYELIGNRPFKNEQSEIFPTISLLPSLSVNSKTRLPEDRPLIIEAAWAHWQGIGKIRSAVLDKNILSFYDKNPKAYNLISDRAEINNLATATPYPEILNSWGYEPYEGHQAIDKALPKWHAAQKANHALRTKNWKLLADLGKEFKEDNWSYVASRNSDLKVTTTNPCIDLLVAKVEPSRAKKQCNDRLTQEFHDYLISDDQQRHDFPLNYLMETKMRATQSMNSKLNLIWFNANRSRLAPQLLELIIELPELEKEKSMLLKITKGNS